MLSFNLNSCHIGGKGNKMISGPKLAVPAIYNFTFSVSDDWNKWGWHRATELFEAVNNIRVSQRKSSLTAWAIPREYPHIDPFTEPNTNGPRYLPYLTLVGNQHTWNTSTCGRNWLEPLVNEDAYIPAKLGMQILKAVKNPVLSKICNALGS